MKDFKLDFTAKTLFAGGDIRTGDTDEQNQRLLLQCEKGSFKEFPGTCVGAATYLEDEDNSDLLREIRTQFTADGMTVRKVVVEQGAIKIDAKYLNRVGPVAAPTVEPD